MNVIENANHEEVKSKGNQARNANFLNLKSVINVATIKESTQNAFWIV